MARTPKKKISAKGRKQHRPVRKAPKRNRAGAPTAKAKKSKNEEDRDAILARMRKDPACAVLFTCPKKYYTALAGRARQVVADQAKHHGLPLAGRTVDLSASIRAFHDFLAKHRYAIAAGTGESGDGEFETKQEADRRKAIAQANLIELQEARQRGETISKAEHLAGRMALLKWFAAIMATAGTELQSRLAGKRPAEQRKIVEAYFTDIRRQVSGR